MGDDTTDEDMFKALEGEAYTIKVNSGASAAQYTILTQQQVIPLLNAITNEPAGSEATGSAAGGQPQNREYAGS
jgi:trehalose 6-phosphate synthase/phosphatase